MGPKWTVDYRPQPHARRMLFHLHQRCPPGGNRRARSWAARVAYAHTQYAVSGGRPRTSACPVICSSTFFFWLFCWLTGSFMVFQIKIPTPLFPPRLPSTCHLSFPSPASSCVLLVVLCLPVRCRSGLVVSMNDLFPGQQGDSNAGCSACCSAHLCVLVQPSNEVQHGLAPPVRHEPHRFLRSIRHDLRIAAPR